MALSPRDSQWEANSSLLVRARILLCVVIGVFILLPIAAMAGGLAIAPLLAICGLAWILMAYPYRLRSIPYWVIAVFAFLFWGFITQFWSPYISDDILSNAVKILIGVGLYCAGLKGLIKAIDMRPVKMTYVFLGMYTVLCVFLTLDVLSGNALTFLVDPLREGEDIVRKRGDIVKNIGNGTVILALFTLPAASLFATGTMPYKWGAFGLIVFIAIIGLKTSMAVVPLALLCAVCVFLFTLYHPRFGVKCVTILAIVSVLFAPLLGLLGRFMPQTWISKLPISWDHRIEMWRFASGKILEAPLFGHGFDSARTFSATYSTRGYEDLSLISLHPHNAGMHIWLETGVIGAVLAAIALWYIGRRALLLSKPSGFIAASNASFIMFVTVIASVSYGVWQDWWWASVILTCACLRLLKYHNP